MKKYWHCQKCGAKTAFQVPEIYRHAKPGTFRSVVYCKCGRQMSLQESAESDSRRTGPLDRNRAWEWLVHLIRVVVLVAIYYGLTTLIEENEGEPIVTIGGLVIMVVVFGMLFAAWGQFSTRQRVGLILAALPMALILLLFLWVLLA